MSDSLNEIIERLNWARSEIGTIEKELEEWVEGSCRCYNGPHPMAGFHGIMFEVKEPLPVSVRARSGTVANEIRSCLDSLASTLAERNGDADGAYFPVADNEAAFTTDKRMRRRLTKFSSADRDALLAFRPFAVGRDGKPGNLLIYGLHHADIKRKHHRLAVKSAKTSLTFNEGRIGELAAEEGRITIPGVTRIGRISQDSTAWLRFDPVILYAEPDVLRGRPLVKTLHEFADVAETIVRTFL